MLGSPVRNAEIKSPCFDQSSVPRLFVWNQPLQRPHKLWPTDLPCLVTAMGRNDGFLPSNLHSKATKPTFTSISVWSFAKIGFIWSRPFCCSFGSSEFKSYTGRSLAKFSCAFCSLFLHRLPAVAVLSCLTQTRKISYHLLVCAWSLGFRPIASLHSWSLMITHACWPNNLSKPFQLVVVKK